MNFHLVQVNIAIARYTCEDPRFAGFVDNLERINVLNTRSPSSSRSSAAARTTAGRFAKMQLLGYYCPGMVGGCPTFRYVYQPVSGSPLVHP